jgi:hypothetical protein
MLVILPADIVILLAPRWVKICTSWPVMSLTAWLGFFKLVGTWEMMGLVVLSQDFSEPSVDQINMGVGAICIQFEMDPIWPVGLKIDPGLTFYGHPPDVGMTKPKGCFKQRPWDVRCHPSFMMAHTPIISCDIAANAIIWWV